MDNLIIYALFLIVLITPLWQIIFWYLDKYSLKNINLTWVYLFGFIITSIYSLYYIFTNIITNDSIPLESLVLNNSFWSYLFLCFSFSLKNKSKSVLLKFILPCICFILINLTYLFKNYLYYEKITTSEYAFNTFIIFTVIYFTTLLVPIFLLTHLPSKNNQTL